MIALVVGVVALAAATAVVWRRPVAAAVLIAFVTPLVAGIDRGRLFPALRPNEALVAFLAGVLLVRAVWFSPTGQQIRIRLTPIELSLLGLAVANSLIPLTVMSLRGQTIAPDDVSYALVLWKYLALYAVVRSAVRTDRDVRMCLWAGLTAATIVGVIGALQALDLAGARAALLDYYAPYGYTGALAAPRGGSTVGLPAATADLLIMNLAAATGLWWKDRRHAVPLMIVALACMGGTLGAAEFSSALGLLIAVVVTAMICGRFGVLKLAPVGALVAGAVMWPVIQHRLDGFDSATGLPISWTTRINNLQNYFLPELLTGTNPLLGVRPSARVAVDHQGTGFVWIESGYAWLLWGGGVPLLIAFVAFVWVALRQLVPLARPVDSYVAVAALAASVGVAVIAVLMVFDPHLTYRGSADWLFSLLAMTAGASRSLAGEPARGALGAETRSSNVLVPTRG